MCHLAETLIIEAEGVPIRAIFVSDRRAITLARGARVRVADHLIEHPVLLGLYELLDTLPVDKSAYECLDLDETIVHLQEELFV